MGWARMWLLGNIGQQMDIEDQRQELRRLRRKIRHAKRANVEQEDLATRIRALETEVDELKLYVLVLLRQMVGKNLATAEELEELVRAVDAEDGTVDGKFEGRVEPPTPQ